MSRSSDRLQKRQDSGTIEEAMAEIRAQLRQSGLVVLKRQELEDVRRRLRQMLPAIELVEDLLDTPPEKRLKI